MVRNVIFIAVLLAVAFGFPKEVSAAETWQNRVDKCYQDNKSTNGNEGMWNFVRCIFNKSTIELTVREQGYCWDWDTECKSNGNSVVKINREVNNSQKEVTKPKRQVTIGYELNHDCNEGQKFGWDIEGNYWRCL